MLLYIRKNNNLASLKSILATQFRPVTINCKLLIDHRHEEKGEDI